MEMVQFHQSYSYEDFVMGYKPNENGGFDLQRGIFISSVQRRKVILTTSISSLLMK